MEKITKQSEKIKKVWHEMKELKMLRDNFEIIDTIAFNNRFIELSVKYKDVDNLFGDENTLCKAIIYYIDNLQIEVFEDNSQVVFKKWGINNELIKK